jgi:3-oxoacyl-[acyl-carrier-protein] synthase-3
MQRLHQPALHKPVFTRGRIAGTGSYVPHRIVTSAELAQVVGSEVDWIHQNLGILERRIAADNEFSSDLGAKAASAAIEAAGIGRDEVDLIIVATATPDRKAPSTACIIQEKLGITNRCPAFDMNAVCSGFLYCMTIGFQLIESGAYRNVVIVGVDTFSKITDWTRRDCVFFGDGAGAVVLQARQDAAGFFSSVLFADGTGQDCFTVRPGAQYFSMDGKAVYETGTKVLPEAINAVLSANALTTKDVDLVIPHQPSIRVLKRTADILEIPFGKIKKNMDRFANTASATVPLLLDQVNRAGEIHTGDTVVFAAVGSGWTWGAAVYTWGL